MVPDQYVQAGQTFLNFERTGVQAGNWLLMAADSVLEHIAFNLPAAESDLSLPSPQALRDHLADAGLTYVTVLDGREAVLRQQVAEQAGGTPLWRWFLYAVLLCLAAEAAIVRWVK
jgi:hypothetical protein